MGARIASVLLISLALASCDREECDNGTKSFPLDTPSTWFYEGRRVSDIPASSKKGLSESYSLTYIQDYAVWGSDDCTAFSGERRSMTYESSLYNHKYNFLIWKKQGGDFLNISEYFEGSLACKINISANDRACQVTYDKNAYYPKPIVSLPYTLIDTIMIDSSIYTNVYKIDLVQRKYSFDERTKVIYFNKTYGLLRFETLEGDEWSLVYR
jgi:hypothetical protein